MNCIKKIRLFILLLLIVVFTGCNSIGMLLFYKGTNTTTLYRSSVSKKNYLVINAIDYKSCGCTELVVDSFKNKNKEFTISIMNGYVKKYIYRLNAETGLKDTVRLQATSYNNFTVAFDPADLAVLKKIDSFSLIKPKGIAYPIKRYSYKGYIQE